MTFSILVSPINTICIIIIVIIRIEEENLINDGNF